MPLLVPHHCGLLRMHVIERLLLTIDPMNVRSAIHLDLALLPRAGRVIAWAVTAVRDMEPPIDAQAGVHCDDEHLDGEVEDVEAGLAVVPGRVVAGPRGHDVGAGSEGGAEAQQDGREQEDGDLGAEAAGAELVEAGGARDHEAGEDEEDGEEGDEGVEDLAVELDVAVDAAGVGVEGEEGLDGAGDEHDEGEDYDGVEGLEGGGESLVPAEVRVRGADDALGEDQVDDEEEDDAGGDEDLGRDGDADVGGAGGPDDAHDARRDARHAEAEHQARHDELMAAFAIELEDGHVRGGTHYEEEHEDGGDGDVDVHGGLAAQGGGLRCVGRARRHLWVLAFWSVWFIEELRW